MEIRLYDSNLENPVLIEVFDSFIWTDRYSEAGDFEIVGKMDLPFTNTRTTNQFLTFDNSEHVMMVEGLDIQSDRESGNKLVARGRSLESILDRRVIWTQTILTGDFQDAIETLLNQNIINPSVTDRQISNFIFEASTDPYITALTIDAQYIGDNLYEVIKSLCQSKDVGFKIVLDSSNNFVFSLYYGEDRSDDQSTNPFIIFSPEFDNLLRSEYSDDKTSLKNVCLIAGEGNGSNRVMTTVRSGAITGLDYEWEGIWRREMFVDASDISKTISGGTLSDAQYLLQLQQRGGAALKENPFTKTFEAEIAPDTMFVYGVDYFLGDLVKIADEYGHESQVRVLEIIHSYDVSGIKAYPTFSSPI